MNKILFVSIPPKSKSAVRATQYKDPGSKLEIIANDCFIPNSPISGKVMEKLTSKFIEVTASDIKEAKLHKIGVCSTCKHTLVANAMGVKAAVKSKKCFCITCGTAVKADMDELNTVIPQALEEENLDLGTDLHNLGDTESSDDKDLARDVIAAMEGEEDPDDGDEYGEDDDGDYGDDNSGDDEDYGDESDDDSEDNDGDDEDPNDDDDSDVESDEDGDEGDEDGGDEDEEPPEDDEQPEEDSMDGQEAPEDDEDDSDQRMDATASLEDGEEEDETEGAMPAVAPDTTVAPPVTTPSDPASGDEEDTPAATQGTQTTPDATDFTISASETLASALANENATVAVLPIDNASAMILAMVEGVGYMPYVAIEAKDAEAHLKPLFSNPSKLIEAVNVVIAEAGEKFNAKSLKRFGVREIAYSVTAPRLIEQRIRTGVTAAAAALQDERNSIVEDLRQCLSIASVEILKNLTSDHVNVVSAELQEQLKKTGVRNANHIVDAVFAEKGPELFKTIIARALEINEKSLDTRNELAKYVTTAAGRDVIAALSPADNVAKTLAQGSVYASTSQTTADTAHTTPADKTTVVASTTSNIVDYSTLAQSVVARRRAAGARN